MTTQEILASMAKQVNAEIKPHCTGFDFEQMMYAVEDACKKGWTGPDDEPEDGRTPLRWLAHLIMTYNKEHTTQ